MTERGVVEVVGICTRVPLLVRLPGAVELSKTALIEMSPMLVAAATLSPTIVSAPSTPTARSSSVKLSFRPSRMAAGAAGVGHGSS